MWYKTLKVIKQVVPVWNANPNGLKFKPTFLISSDEVILGNCVDWKKRMILKARKPMRKLRSDIRKLLKNSRLEWR